MLAKHDDYSLKLRFASYLRFQNEAIHYFSIKIRIVYLWILIVGSEFSLFLVFVNK